MPLIFGSPGVGKNRDVSCIGEEDGPLGRSLLYDSVKGLVIIGKHATIIMWRRVCAHAAIHFIFDSRRQSLQERGWRASEHVGEILEDRCNPNPGGGTR